MRSYVFAKRVGDFDYYVSGPKLPPQGSGWSLAVMTPAANQNGAPTERSRRAVDRDDYCGFGYEDEDE